MKDEIKEILFLLHNDRLTESGKRQLEDYITNLQKENQKLKQPQIFIDTMDMEERYGQELYEDYLKEQLENYKSRIDKATEYIKEWQSFPHTNGSTHNELRNLLNILNGGDDNE